MARTWATTLIGLVFLLPSAFAPDTVSTQTRTSEREIQIPEPDAGLRVDLLQDLSEADLAVHGSASGYLAFARDARLTVIVATTPGATGTVAEAIRRNGGEIDARDERVGYLRVRIPEAQWPAIRALPDVEAAQLDGRRMLTGGWVESEASVVGYLNRDVPTAPRPSTISPPPSSQQRDPVAREPLSPADLAGLQSDARDALGLDALIRDHPTFDGRGIGIAIVEPNATSALLDHAAFSRARTTSGAPIPKIADVLPSPDNVWMRVKAQRRIDASELLVRFNDTLHRLPRIGRFDWGELRLAQRHYSVLWCRETGEIWVDVNQDFNFQNDSPMQDGRVHASVGQFSHDVGWRGGRFRVIPAQDGNEVVIVPVETSPGSHAAMAASIAAGADVPENLARGVAPGARLILVDVEDTSTHAVLEAMMRAARHPDVDVISASFAMAETMPASDREVAAIVLDRTVAVYGKLILRSAGNGYVAEAIRAGAGQRVLSVGSALTPFVAGRFLNLHNRSDVSVSAYSSRGPRSDGRGLPDVVAPASMIAAALCDQLDVRRVGSFLLPPCYSLSGGSSASAPIVAGMIACLLSGAKQRGVVLPAADIQWALRASARFLPGARVIDQGSGMPDAAKAWRLLSEPQRPPAIASWGPLSHSLASYRRSPDTGASLYEREGWTPGDRRTRRLALYRADGPAVDMPMLATWLGNDGTFEAPDVVQLPRGRLVELPVTVKTARAGIHSALLVLRDPVSKVALHQVPVTVVAADTFGPAHGYELHYGRFIGPLEASEHAFHVPTGLHDFRVRVQTEDRSGDQRALLMLMDPRGAFYDRIIERAPHLGFKTGQLLTFTIPNPTPGVWLATVIPNDGANNVDELWQTPALRYRLDIAAHRLNVSVRPQSTSETRITLGVENAGAELSPFSVTAELAQAARRETMFVSAHRPLVFPFDVVEGAVSAVVRVTTPGSVCGSHLYLYDCSSGTCLRQDAVVPAAPEQTVRLAPVAAGTWKAVVTQGPTCTGTERVTFETFMANPPAGQTAARWSALPSTLRRGQRWTGAYDIVPAQPSTPNRLALIVSFGTPSDNAAPAEARRGSMIVPVGAVIPLAPVRTNNVQSRHRGRLIRTGAPASRLPSASAFRRSCWSSCP